MTLRKQAKVERAAQDAARWFLGSQVQLMTLHDYCEASCCIHIEYMPTTHMVECVLWRAAELVEQDSYVN